jgi:hypothetical protein
LYRHRPFLLSVEGLSNDFAAKDQLGQAGEAND